MDREMLEKVVELQEKMLKMEEAGRVAREQESKMKFMQDQKLIQRFSQDQNATVELEYEVTLSTVKKPANSFAAPNYSAVAMDMGGSILKYDGKNWAFEFLCPVFSRKQLIVSPILP